MKLAKILMPLALLPAALSAQSTIFHTDFSTGNDTLNQASFTPTSSSTNWDIVSSKNATTSAVSSSGLLISMASTSAGVVEAQTVFSSSPVQLSNTGDFITATAVFTATNNILTGGLGSRLYIGLYNSAGSLPLNTLNNAGLTTAASDKTTGGTIGWQGYTGAISFDGSNTSIATRPIQNTGTLTNAAQDLALSGSGGYNYPAGQNLVLSTATSATASLTNGQQYTLTYSINMTSATSATITINLYDGVGTTGLNEATIVGTATGANLLTTAFDGLMIGERYANTAAASSMTITDLAITTNVSAVPEPATYAAILGAAGLAVAAIRRRRL